MNEVVYMSIYPLVSWGEKGIETYTWNGEPISKQEFFKLLNGQDNFITVEEFKVLYPEKQCSHSWAQYVGFTEEFNYCTLCDEKKR